VVRSPSEFTVQKRKGFNVTEPQCTFDTTHNRCGPYSLYAVWHSSRPNCLCTVVGTTRTRSWTPRILGRLWTIR
jgi:hypothetical protein